MNKGINQSTSSHVTSRKYSKRIRRSIARLSDNQLDDPTSRAIVWPTVTHNICINNSSVSVTTADPINNKTTASNSSKKKIITKVGREKMKKKNLTKTIF